MTIQLLNGCASGSRCPRRWPLGEIGLDYHYDNAPHETQLDVFLRQLLLARELNLPVIMHIRDAHGDATSLLRAHRAELPEGVMHCFSGSVETARIYLDMGFYISFAGAVTFKNAAKLPDVARYVPADRILVETDCPYMAPVPGADGAMNRHSCGTLRRALPNCAAWMQPNLARNALKTA